MDLTFSNRYRNGTLNKATTAFSTAVWGILVTGTAVAVVSGAVLFFFIWAETSYWAFALLGQIFGLGLSLVIRFIIIKGFEKFLIGNVGVYRRKVWLSNVLAIILEIWNAAGIGVGFVAARAVVIIALTTVFLGRVDSPVLAPNVMRILGQTLDRAPEAFTCQLITQEAHHHPYMERLGVMYLIKSGDPDNFATRAGCMWRLIFVEALYPWLRKYRQNLLTSTPIRASRWGDYFTGIFAESTARISQIAGPVDVNTDDDADDDDETMDGDGAKMPLAKSMPTQKKSIKTMKTPRRRSSF